MFFLKKKIKRFDTIGLRLNMVSGILIAEVNDMRKVKQILFLAVSILLFTACDKKNSVDHGQDSGPVLESYDSQVEKQAEKQTEQQTEQQTKEEIRSRVPESEQAGGNNGSAAYEEYLNSLQYIDEIGKTV